MFKLRLKICESVYVVTKRFFGAAKTQLRDDQGIYLAIAGRRRHARCIAAAGAKEVCSSFARIDVGVLK